jgi:hypothetical protein
MAGGMTPILAELGQTEQALTDAARLADRLEHAGNIDFTEPRSLQIRLLIEQGRHDQAPDPEPLLQAARDGGHPPYMAVAVAAAAALHNAQNQPDQARLLLHELAQNTTNRNDPIYATVLPGLVRTALNLHDPTLAHTLTDGVPPLTPLQQHALTSSHAQQAEATGNHSQAATLYTDAAQHWHQYGNLPETAYALQSQGRCLHALNDPAAEQPLSEARELFASMGYKPALAETEALLEQAQAAAS